MIYNNHFLRLLKKKRLVVSFKQKENLDIIVTLLKSNFNLSLMLKFTYLKLAIILLLIWAVSITLLDEWYLLKEFWEVPLTMTLGSFVAGFSAEGGGAIAFPIFTKVLHIVPLDAKQFSLLIQSVGMTMASIFILYKKIHFHSFAIFPAVLGGILGQLISFASGLSIESNHLKWIFTIHITALAIALIIKQLLFVKSVDIIKSKNKNKILFFTGILGGVLTINIGSGADLIAFIILTLILNSKEKKATPTTVIIMALNSIIGVMLISAFGNWSSWSVNAWKTAIPVVIFGAPIGAYFASLISNSLIIKFLISLIIIEVISTIWLVPMPSWVIPVFMSMLIIIFITTYVVNNKLNNKVL
ncbi:sulfite exporter TauE/SafE family protein [Aquimarina sp. RZ0]|uniref:sulfite exporter TauE/SafE family protein n=1 Tax=Aquimarina sp. RZ0 TaxID=2607730 RepID=UPI0011F34D53|nr:sulfite exporter TauE/SafE family protein [Aquimarina sp. RZ0]KAA1246819.1 sulfite exporter TauE/SafE family protein [Aquimarina sp. RZ0]